jgi:putative membrane protein
MSRTRAIAFSALGGAAAAILTANIAFAEGRGDGFGRGHRGDGFMLIFPVLLLIAAAALAVALWRGRHPMPSAAPLGPPAPPSPTLNAQAILADRLARGEITPDDYRAAITVLRETPAPPPVG